MILQTPFISNQKLNRLTFSRHWTKKQWKIQFSFEKICIFFQTHNWHKHPEWDNGLSDYFFFIFKPFLSNFKEDHLLSRSCHQFQFFVVEFVDIFGGARNAHHITSYLIFFQIRIIGSISRLIDRLIDHLFFVRLIDWSIDWLIGQLIAFRSIDWLIDWLID